MNLQKYPSPETCRLLKDSGWKAETEKIWIEDYPFGEKNPDKWILGDATTADYLPAPDALELLEALPPSFDTEEDETVCLIFSQNGAGKWVDYEYESFQSITDLIENRLYIRLGYVEQLARLWLWVKEYYPEFLPK